ncbi:MAG: hypothetical protein K0U98_08635 [Deltaproteobacteria bacterium]|nr:hypothetical protein [Deltaproteobacteria bacterium]
MTPSEELLADFVERAAVEECIEWLAQLSAKQRRELRSVASRIFENSLNRKFAGPPSEAEKAHQRCAGVAVLGTCTWGQAKNWTLWHALGGLPQGVEDGRVQVLMACRPPWLNKWASWACEEMGFYLWPAVRMMEREALVERPEELIYVRAMVSALGQEGSRLEEILDTDPELLEIHIWKLFEVDCEPGGEWTRALVRCCQKGSLDLGRLVGATLDGLERDLAPPQSRWVVRLVRSLEEAFGDLQIPPERWLRLLYSKRPSTLDLALSELKGCGPSSPEEAIQWLSSLEPTLRSPSAGRVKRALTLIAQVVAPWPDLQLLGAETAAIALEHPEEKARGFALDRISSLGQEGAPNLRSLLETAAELSGPRLRQRIQEVLEGEGASESVSMSGGASAESELPSIASLRCRAKALAPSLLLSVGIDLAALEKQSSQEVVAEESVARKGYRGSLASLELRKLPVSRLEPNREIAAISDLDELLEEALLAFEEQEDAIRLHRVLGGISALCAERPADFDRRAAPLVQRAEEVAPHVAPEGLDGQPFQIAYGRLVLSWLRGDPPAYPSLGERWRSGGDSWPQRLLAKVLGRSPLWPEPPRDVGASFAALAVEIARRARLRTPVPLLSTPTHEPSWIDPLRLVNRWVTLTSAGGKVEPVDGALALLRLAPTGRPEALDAMPSSSTDFAQALQYALGKDSVSVGRAKGWWFAAASSWCPRGEAPEVLRRHRESRAGGGAWQEPQVTFQDVRSVSWGRYLALQENFTRSPKSPAPEEVSLLHYHSPFCGSHPWPSSVFPGDSDPIFLGLANVVLRAGNASLRGHWGPAYALLDPDEIVTPAVYWLLAVSLLSPQREPKLWATEFLLQSLEDSRLDAVAFGWHLAALCQPPTIRQLPGPPPFWPVDPPKLLLQRAAPVLEVVGRQSPRHALGVLVALEVTLGRIPDSLKPSTLLPLLRWVDDASLELGRGILDPHCRAFLQGVPGKGETARVASRLLERQDRPEIWRERDFRLQLAARLERAERWQHRISPSP